MLGRLHLEGVISEQYRGIGGRGVPERRQSLFVRGVLSGLTSQGRRHKLVFLRLEPSSVK